MTRAKQGGKTRGQRCLEMPAGTGSVTQMHNCLTQNLNDRRPGWV